MKDKIIVVGCAGFIGSHLTDKLVDLGYTVIGLDNLSSGKKENINRDSIFYKIDICNKEAVDWVFQAEKPDYVFHLGAQVNLRKSIEDPIFDAQNNIMGSLNLIKAAEEAQVKKFIFTSTGGAIYSPKAQLPWAEDSLTDPASPYGLSKLTVERYLKLSKLNYVIYRLANVYGERQSPSGEAGVVSIFINKLLHREEPTIFGTGNQTRDFVYVKDVIDGLILPLTRNLSKDNHNVFNIGTGKKTSVLEIWEEVKQHFDFNVEPIFTDPIKGEVYQSVLSVEKIEHVFGTKLAEGIAKTVHWFKNGEK